MANLLSYKGYEGTIEFDPEAKVLRGKILYIPDLVTFQSSDCKEIESEFKLAVDDYIDFCKEIGRNPAKPMSGQFNVRISPDLHRAAASRAIIDGISLNAVVSAALETYVGTPRAAVNEAIAATTALHTKTLLEWASTVTLRKSSPDLEDLLNITQEAHIISNKRANLWH
ncbi:HicB family protein [compost metagenome]